MEIIYDSETKQKCMLKKYFAEHRVHFNTIHKAEKG